MRSRASARQPPLAQVAHSGEGRAFLAAFAGGGKEVLAPRVEELKKPSDADRFIRQLKDNICFDKTKT
eukprot:6643750-Lingulodinium_polyedra.AAC.1